MNILNIEKGDYVTRNSYDNDTVFKVINIKNGIVYLKGVEVRLIADADITDLRKEEKALKSELFKLRFQHALNGLDNPKKMELVKKNIARVNTVITKKEKNI